MASAASLHDPASRLIAASDAAKAAARSPSDAEKASQKGASDKPHMSFWDFVDIVNPLQHIPVVGTIYREITHDTIRAPAKIAGSALYGGPIGLALAVGDQIIEAKSGKSVEGHVMALFRGDKPAASDTMLAANEPAAELTENEIDALTVDRAPAAPSPVQVALLDAPTATPAPVAATQMPANPVAVTQVAAAQPVAPPAAAAAPASGPDPRLVAARARIIAAQAAMPPASLAAPANSPLVLDQNTDAVLMAMFGGGAKPTPAPAASAGAPGIAPGPAAGIAAPATASGAIPIAAATAPIAVSPKPVQVASAAAASESLAQAVRPADASRGLGLDAYRTRAGAAPVRDPMPNKFAQINQREANRAPAAVVGIARPAAPETKAAAAPPAPANTDAAPPLDLATPLPREQIPAAMIAAMEKYQAQARSRGAGGVDQRM